MWEYSFEYRKLVEQAFKEARAQKHLKYLDEKGRLDEITKFVDNKIDAERNRRRKVGVQLHCAMLSFTIALMYLVGS